MSSWPETLPALPLQEGFTETLKDVVLRTQTDIGPAKTRARYTAGVETYSMQFLLTLTEKGYLNTFYLTTLVNGSLSFTWTNPSSGVSGTFRFLGPPSYGAPVGSHIYATLQLELLP